MGAETGRAHFGLAGPDSGYFELLRPIALHADLGYSRLEGTHDAHVRINGAHLGR